MKLDIGCTFLAVAGLASSADNTTPNLRRLCSSVGDPCNNDNGCCGDLFCENLGQGNKQCAEANGGGNPPTADSTLSIQSILLFDGSKMTFNADSTEDDGKIFYNDKVEFLITNVYPLEENQVVRMEMACDNGAIKRVAASTSCEQCVDATAVLVPNKLNSDRPVVPQTGGTFTGWIGSWDPFTNDDGPGCDDYYNAACECAQAARANCTFKAYKEKSVKIKGKWTKVIEDVGEPIVVDTQMGPRSVGDCFCNDDYDICNCANGCSPHPNCWYNYYGTCSDQYKCCL